MNSGARRGARARCRTGSLPEHAHIRAVRVKGDTIALPTTHRDCRPIVSSARLWIRAPALLSRCHFSVNVDSSEDWRFPSTDQRIENQKKKKERNGDTHFHAQLSFFVFVTTVRLATCDMEARASPRNPYVVRWERSENLDILEVVKRCASIGRSDFYSPHHPQG